MRAGVTMTARSGGSRQLGQARVRALPEDLAVLRIDGVERAAQPAGGEVAIHDAAERALALGGADQRDAARREQRPQVMLGHGADYPRLA